MQTFYHAPLLHARQELREDGTSATAQRVDVRHSGPVQPVDTTAYLDLQRRSSGTEKLDRHELRAFETSRSRSVPRTLKTSFYSDGAWPKSKSTLPQIFVSSTGRRPDHVMEFDRRLRAAETLAEFVSCLSHTISQFDIGNIVIAFSCGVKIVDDRSLATLQAYPVWDSLLCKVLRCVGDLEPRGLSMVAYSAAKVSWKDAQLRDALASTGTHKSRDFSATDIAKMCWAFVKLDWVNEARDLWEVMEKEAVRKVGTGKFVDVSMIAWAFASASLGSKALYAEISKATLGMLHEMPPQSLANIAYAFARANMPDVELFKALTRRALEVVGSFIEFDVASLCWALAESGHINAILMDSLATHVVQSGLIKRFNGQMATQMAWAFAVANLPHVELFDGLDAFISKHAAVFDSQHVALSAWAYAKIGLHPSQAFESLKAIGTGCKLKEFHGEDVCNLWWAFTRLKCVDQELLRHAVEIMATTLEETSGKNLANLMLSLVSLRDVEVELPEMLHALLDKVSRSFQSNALQHDAEAVLVLIRALSKARHIEAACSLLERASSPYDSSVNQCETSLGVAAHILDWRQSCASILAQTERLQDLDRTHLVWAKLAGSVSASPLQAACLEAPRTMGRQVSDNLTPGECGKPPGCVPHSLRSDEVQLRDDVLAKMLEAVQPHANLSSTAAVVRGLEDFAATCPQFQLVSMGHASVLDEVLKSIRPAITLELGTRVGYSTLRLAACVQQHQGKVITVEPDPINAACARNLFEAAAMMDTITSLVGMSEDNLPIAKSMLGAGRVDLMIINGAPDAQCLRDLEQAEELGLLSPDCTIVAHHVLKPGAPRFLWNLKSSSYSSELVSTTEPDINGSLDWTLICRKKLSIEPVQVAMPNQIPRLAAESAILWRQQQHTLAGSKTSEGDIADLSDFGDRLQMCMAQLGWEPTHHVEAARFSMENMQVDSPSIEHFFIGDSEASLVGRQPASAASAAVVSGNPSASAFHQFHLKEGTFKDWVRAVDALGRLDAYIQSLEDNFDNVEQIVKVYSTTVNESIVLDTKFFEDINITAPDHTELFQRWFSQNLGGTTPSGFRRQQTEHDDKGAEAPQQISIFNDWLLEVDPTGGLLEYRKVLEDNYDTVTQIMRTYVQPAKDGSRLDQQFFEDTNVTNQEHRLCFESWFAKKTSEGDMNVDMAKKLQKMTFRDWLLDVDPGGDLMAYRGSCEQICSSVIDLVQQYIIRHNNQSFLDKHIFKVLSMTNSSHQCSLQNWFTCNFYVAGALEGSGAPPYNSAEDAIVHTSNSVSPSSIGQALHTISIKDWLSQVDSTCSLSMYQDALESRFATVAQIVNSYANHTDHKSQLDVCFFEDVGVQDTAHQNLFKKWFTRFASSTLCKASPGHTESALSPTHQVNTVQCSEFHNTPGLEVDSSEFNAHLEHKYPYASTLNDDTEQRSATPGCDNMPENVHVQAVICQKEAGDELPTQSLQLSSELEEHLQGGSLHDWLLEVDSSGSLLLYLQPMNDKYTSPLEVIKSQCVQSPEGSKMTFKFNPDLSIITAEHKALFDAWLNSSIIKSIQENGDPLQLHNSTTNLTAPTVNTNQMDDTGMSQEAHVVDTKESLLETSTKAQLNHTAIALVAANGISDSDPGNAALVDTSGLSGQQGLDERGLEVTEILDVGQDLSGRTENQKAGKDSWSTCSKELDSLVEELQAAAGHHTPVSQLSEMQDSAIHCCLHLMNHEKAQANDLAGIKLGNSEQCSSNDFTKFGMDEATSLTACLAPYHRLTRFLDACQDIRCLEAEIEQAQNEQAVQLKHSIQTSEGMHVQTHELSSAHAVHEKLKEDLMEHGTGCPERFPDKDRRTVSGMQLHDNEYWCELASSRLQASLTQLEANHHDLLQTYKGWQSRNEENDGRKDSEKTHLKELNSLVEELQVAASECAHEGTCELSSVHVSYVNLTENLMESGSSHLEECPEKDERKILGTQLNDNQLWCDIASGRLQASPSQLEAACQDADDPDCGAARADVLNHVAQGGLAAMEKEQHEACMGAEQPVPNVEESPHHEQCSSHGACAQDDTSHPEMHSSNSSYGMETQEQSRQQSASGAEGAAANFPQSSTKSKCAELEEKQVSAEALLHDQTDVEQKQQLVAPTHEPDSSSAEVFLPRAGVCPKLPEATLADLFMLNFRDWLWGIDESGMLLTYLHPLQRKYDTPLQVVKTYLVPDDGKNILDEHFFIDVGVTDPKHRAMFETWFAERGEATGTGMRESSAHSAAETDNNVNLSSGLQGEQATVTAQHNNTSESTSQNIVTSAFFDFDELEGAIQSNETELDLEGQGLSNTPPLADTALEDIGVADPQAQSAASREVNPALQHHHVQGDDCITNALHHATSTSTCNIPKLVTTPSVATWFIPIVRLRNVEKQVGQHEDSPCDVPIQPSSTAQTLAAESSSHSKAGANSTSSVQGVQGLDAACTTTEDVLQERCKRSWTFFDFAELDML